MSRELKDGDDEDWVVLCSICSIHDMRYGKLFMFHWLVSGKSCITEMARLYIGTDLYVRWYSMMRGTRMWPSNVRAIIIWILGDGPI